MRKVLKRMRPLLAALATGALLWCGAPAVQAMDEIMPLSELEEGMTGELYTVVDSSGDIRSFEVTILGVMRNGKSMPFILARSEGAFADTDGGLMQGMSGSPVYVDGRLIGAGSATLKEMNPHTFLITPIEEMLPIWDMPDTKNQGRPSTVDLKKAAKEKAEKEAEENKKDEGKAPKAPTAEKVPAEKDKADDKGKKAESAGKDSPQKTESSSQEPGKGSSAKGKEASAAKDEEKTSKRSEALESKDSKGEEKQSKRSENRESKDAKDEAKSSKPSEVQESKESKGEEKQSKGSEASESKNPKGEEKTPKRSEVLDRKGAEPKESAGKDGKENDGKQEKNENEKRDGATTEPAKERQEKALVYAAGFGEAGMRFLQEKLEPMGCRADAFGGISGLSHGTDYEAVLYPGSPVGAALAYGDFALAATGTITAVEEDGRILAFGHSFLHRGNVNYFMTDASIFGMVNGMTDGMKLASTGNVIGRINQDRTAGIAGIVGMFPTVVPIRLTVEDKTLGRSASYAATMAYDEAFVPVLTQAIAYAALGRTVDTLNESTVKVDFAIRTDAMDSGVFERTNLFYAGGDTGQIAFAELAKALSLIAGDTEGEADVYDVKVDISSEAKRMTASLVSAMPDKMVVKPGEALKFKVTLRPYRDKEVTVEVPFNVPKTQREGTMNLDVHGGGLVSIEKLLQAAQAEMGIIVPDAQGGSKTAKDALLDMEKTDANKESVIELGAGPVLSEKEQQKEIEAAIRWQEEMQASGQKEPPAPPRAKLATDYVIDNVIHTAVKVSRKGE